MASVPQRLQWAVEALDVGSGDRILEVGCGPGVAAGLICDRLVDGHLTAIDRSAVAIGRAARRNAHHVAAGRVTFRQVDLAALTAPDASFDKILAVNVNVFWTRPDGPELPSAHRLLRPGGALLLCYSPPDPDRAAQLAATVAAALERHGFSAVGATHGSPGLLCLSARAGCGPVAGSGRCRR